MDRLKLLLTTSFAHHGPAARIPRNHWRRDYDYKKDKTGERRREAGAPVSRCDGKKSGSYPKVQCRYLTGSDTMPDTPQPQEIQVYLLGKLLLFPRHGRSEGERETEKESR